MSAPRPLRALARRAGIALEWWDIFGRRYETPEGTLKQLLAAMDIPAGTEAETAESLHRLSGEAWEGALPPVVVLRRRPGESALVPLTRPESGLEGVVHWTLVPAAGEPEEESRHPRRGTIPLPSLVVLDRAAFDGQRLRRLGLPLPDGLPEGYWDLTVELPGGTGAATRVVLAPPSAWEPPWMGLGKRRWGIAAHLYSLRGHHDLGIGDFGQLRRLVDLAAGVGADYIGLNPLHALFGRHPDRRSPYAPSDRRFLNPLYLEVSAVTGFTECEAVRKRMGSASFRRALERTRSRDLIDYPALARRKRELLGLLHTAFRERRSAGLPLPGEAEDYAAFRMREGRALEYYALFESIQEEHRGRVPAALRDPDSAAAMAFVVTHQTRLDFHRFLQWQADRQLKAVAHTTRQAGLEGLYRDLAVGAHPQGAEVWSQPGLFARGVAFGAPPDAFNLQGQTWGMPPLEPRALRAAGYAPFIRLLRANLRHAAALRIDHVMALRRLFWIPDGAPAVEGSYVDYPFDDLLGIVTLESRRHRCLVVGEDLGTVPEGLRERLEAERIWSYRLMLFERWPDGLFHRPDQYPERAVATFTSHDLPTLAGWWQGSDLAERVALGLLADRPPEEAAVERARDREQLRAALADQGLPGGETSGPGDLKEVARGVQCFLARSPAGLMMANLDDLLLEERQLNQPGTVDEYPNWRRRPARPLEDLSADLYLRTTAEAIVREREGPAPPAA